MHSQILEEQVDRKTERKNRDEFRSSSSSAVHRALTNFRSLLKNDNPQFPSIPFLPLKLL